MTVDEIEDGGNELLPVFGVIWLACGVVAFVIFSFLSAQRAVRNFRRNKIQL